MNKSVKGRFVLILFAREKADKVCRLINFELESEIGKNWKRVSDPRSDPIIQNPNKKQSLFINAFQVKNQIVIITRYRCLIYDFDLKAEEKAITFAEFGPNKEFEKVFCFNNSFNMDKAD